MDKIIVSTVWWMMLAGSSSTEKSVWSCVLQAEAEGRNVVIDMCGGIMKLTMIVTWWCAASRGQLLESHLAAYKHGRGTEQHGKDAPNDNDDS